jgi:carboxylesterase
MGGVLSLLMSTRLSVNGVVAMSTPFKMANDWRLNFTDWLGKIQPYLPKADEPNSGWFDHKAMADHVSYPENPVGSIGELNKLIIEMRAALPEVHVPVLLIHSNDDTYVPPQNMENIFANLVNADDKAKFYITGSGHVMTRDAARLQVFETASRFIQRVESQFR